MHEASKKTEEDEVQEGIGRDKKCKLCNGVLSEGCQVVLYLGQTLECASAPHATWAILAPVPQTGAARAPFLAVERSHKVILVGSVYGGRRQ